MPSQRGGEHYLGPLRQIGGGPLCLRAIDPLSSVAVLGREGQFSSPSPTVCLAA